MSFAEPPMERASQPTLLASAPKALPMPLSMAVPTPWPWFALGAGALVRVEERVEPFEDFDLEPLRDEEETRDAMRPTLEAGSLAARLPRPGHGLFPLTSSRPALIRRQTKWFQPLSSDGAPSTVTPSPVSTRPMIRHSSGTWFASGKVATSA